jgi:hypothetical protein
MNEYLFLLFQDAMVDEEEIEADIYGHGYTLQEAT